MPTVMAVVGLVVLGLGAAVGCPALIPGTWSYLPPSSFDHSTTDQVCGHGAMQ